MKEVWQPVTDYIGMYEVSNTGQVRSLSRVISLKDGKTKSIKGRVLKPKKHTDGYLFVTLSKHGVAENKYIHRLVAAAYLLNLEQYPEVNHLSGNKADNTVSNLAWCTHRENVQHAYDSGLCSQIGGSHHLAIGVVDNFLGREYSSIKEWAEARGINYTTGRNMLIGKQMKNDRKVVEKNWRITNPLTNDKSKC